MTSTPAIVFEKIERLRTRAGLSERALARVAGFAESALAQCRKRQSAPSPDLAKQVADYFGTDVLDILDDDHTLPMVPIRYRSREGDAQVADMKPSHLPPRDKISKLLARVATMERELASLRTAIEDLLVP